MYHQEQGPSKNLVSKKKIIYVRFGNIFIKLSIFKVFDRFLREITHKYEILKCNNVGINESVVFHVQKSKKLKKKSPIF